MSQLQPPRSTRHTPFATGRPATRTPRASHPPRNSLHSGNARRNRGMGRRGGSMFSGANRTTRFFQRYKLYLIGLVAALLLIALISSMVSCVSSLVSPKEEPAAPVAATSLQQDTQDALAQAVDHADKIKQLAAQANSYTSDDLVYLGLREPAALDFVLGYPKLSKHEAQTGDALSATKGQVNPLYTWDNRWGAVDFAGKPFAVSGSGPVVLTMARAGLLGQADKRPEAIAALIEKAGQATGDTAMSADYLLDHAKDLGLSAKFYAATGKNITAVVNETTYLALPMSADSLTSEAHWVLVWGKTEAGAVMVYDPSSTEVSSRSWDPSVIANGSIKQTAYALTAATTDDTQE